MKTCKKVYISPKGESTTASADATALELRFTNKKTVTVDFTKLPANIAAAAMRHGISQKVGDSFASSESVDDAEAAARETLAQLMAGDWNTRTSGSGVLAEAVARVQKVPVDKAQAIIAKMTPDKLAAVKAHPDVKAALATIAAERAAARAKSTKSDVNLADLFKA